MVTIEGFQVAFKYIQLFKEGLICTISLSALTVVAGFILIKKGVWINNIVDNQKEKGLNKG